MARDNHTTTLPPLAGGGRSAGAGNPLSKLGLGGLLRSGSRELAPSATPGPEELIVSHSALSGSSKTPFPPDRSFVNDFEWTKHSRDLPPEVRPIIEDNKMLQEELRRYRSRVGEQEGLLLAADRTIVSLRDELARERQHLRECAVSPAQVLQDQKFRQALEERDASIRQLQQRGDILERAKLAAERRFAGDLAAERKAQGELKRQLQLLQDQVEEKEKQDRFSRLQINQLYRRLAPLEAAVAAAAAAPPPPPPPEPAPAPEPEVQVQLMLVNVYAQPQPTAEEIAMAAARLAAEEAARRAAELLSQGAAAVCIQAAARGFLVRRRLAEQHAAATAIQAAARGMLVRRAVWTPQLHQQKCEPLLDGGDLLPSQRLAQRQQAAERQYHERAAAAKAKQQKRLPPRPGTRSANTAVEAAAPKRGFQQPTPGDGASAPGGGGVSSSPGGNNRQPSSLLGQGGGAGGGGSPSRRASAVAIRRPSNAAALKTGSGSPGSSSPNGGGTLGPNGSFSGSHAVRATTQTNAGGSPGGSSSPGRQRGQRASVVHTSGVPCLDLHQGQGGSTSRRRTTDGSKGTRRGTLGFASSAARRSMAGGI